MRSERSRHIDQAMQAERNERRGRHSQCEQLTDDVLMAVAQGCPNLTKLDV